MAERHTTAGGGHVRGVFGEGRRPPPAPPRGYHALVPSLRVPAALAVAAILLTGCGIKDEPVGAPPAFPLVTRDATDVEIRLDRAPQSIVTSDAGAANVLRELGVGDRVLQVEPADLPRTVTAEEPDLVVIPLDGPAPTPPGDAAVFRYGAVEIDAAPLAISRLGLAVGRGPEAAELARRVAEGLTALRTRVDGQDPVPTLIEAGGFEGLGPETPLGLAVAYAGGANPLSVSQPLELIAVADLAPAAWIATEPGGTPLARLRTIPELRTVPAIADGRVIPAPAAGYPVDGALPAALDELARALRGGGSR